MNQVETIHILSNIYDFLPHPITVCIILLQIEYHLLISAFYYKLDNNICV